ncbi:glycosyl hydrolase family 71-domain-containing protein [Microdochium trichocladiopsis]|uniref:Glycosyl hydrolase family 71-domain-containing protein n=1 Tax=Microdochium trichocladiopsis TaxID=1682393 RepID=A0A9P9BGA9_9PEZI|nr:glycosyl hydrolase family 71-domain-containing protein [Microdochium trichocladiopsis]KAH7014504.1 glycosyl hydrolase family 71-domain-containing protein [Microdochium trichocladiopsis]
MFARFRSSLLAAAAVLAAVSNASPYGVPAERAVSSDRLVACHFMMGIVSGRTSARDYDLDMQLARDAGIDAFALNIGTDSFTDQQLDYAYQSAADNGMKVFISFDFNWYNSGQAAQVGQKIAKYGGRPGQLIMDGRIFASTFASGNPMVDSAIIKSAAGSNVYWIPNFYPGQSLNSVDGAFNWMAWPNDGNNKAPKPGRSVSVEDGDNTYLNWLGGRPYMAPVSPWFFTHYGPEVSYSKNWVFPSGSLLFDRWNTVLARGFPMVEIITWNDYGESHYIGPLRSKHYDDGNSKWVNDMPHNGWLELSKPFIAAYKAKATSVNNYITDEKVIYWYRRNLKSTNCDATDTTAGRPANNDSGNYFMGRPDGYNTMDDVVYVATLLKSAGTITVTSGNTVVTRNVPAGASLIQVPAGLGKQKFSLTRNNAVVLEGTSLMDISNECPCGLYNYNAYVGTLPPGPNDPLGADGLSMLTAGLRVTTCQPTPSLGTNPPVATGPTSPTTTTVPPGPSPTGTCNAGTNADGESGNFSGLCSFTCSYGYCPPGPCKCTSYGTPGTPPASNGRDGCPAAGLPDSYKGLCSYTCNHGYCPEGACRYC